MRTARILVICAGLLPLATAFACGGSGSSSEGGGARAAGGSAAGGSAGSGAVGGIFSDGAGGSAANAGFGGDACAGETLTAEAKGRPADIIIAIDQSTSMTEETQFVQQQLNGFATQITGKGIDARVILIAENPSGPVGENLICVPPPLAGPNCGDNPSKAFSNVNHHVDSHDAFGWILDCFAGGNAHESCYDSESEPFSCQFSYRDALRPEAVKHVVVISDDEPCMDATEFDQEFLQLDPARHGDYLFHAIVPFTDCPYSAGPPDEYLALVQTRAGVSGDLCVQNFQPVWDRLAQSVIQNSLLSCAWDIPAVPSGQTFDPDRVNVSYTVNGQKRDLGRVGSAADCARFQGGWYFDDPARPTRILVCADVCDQIKVESGQQQQIDILVGCRTVFAPPK